MLNIKGEIKFSEYTVLYDMLIPKDNKYRLIDELMVMVPYKYRKMFL